MPPRIDSISGRGPLQAPQPRTVAIPEFVERNMLASREPAKTSQVACGATSVTNLLQIRDPLKDLSHPDAEALIYVVGGVAGGCVWAGRGVSTGGGVWAATSAAPTERSMRPVDTVTRPVTRRAVAGRIMPVTYIDLRTRREREDVSSRRSRVGRVRARA